MEKKHIAALLESLCERPLSDSHAEPSAELQALCREAVKALSQAGDAQACPTAEVADADRLTAALAALLSGVDADAARRTVEDAALQSAAVRLDAQSAIAFVDAIEQSPLSAPAHLVDEILASDGVRAARSPRPSAGATNSWSLIAGASWSARRWRMAAACAVLLAGVASWSAYWQRTNPAVEAGPLRPAASDRSAVADAPAPPRPALATTQPCEEHRPTGEVTVAQNSDPAGGPKPAEAAAGAGCAPAPDGRLADRPAGETEATRQRAEAARQAADPNHGPIRADRSGPTFGATYHNPPAAAQIAPAAAPATPPSPPAATR